MAFPTLFPDGKGDPTSPNLNRDVPFNSAIKHLLKFGEVKNGQWNYRFEKHPRFSYWALNMIQRKRTLQQGSIFIKQNAGDSHFTIARNGFNQCIYSFIVKAFEICCKHYWQ